MAKAPRDSKHHEARHKHGEEMEFRIAARRNRLLGLWAAEKMGLAGDDAVAYAKEVVASDFDEPGEEDVFRKVMADFRAKEVAVTESELRDQMFKLLTVARDQLVVEK